MANPKPRTYESNGFTAEVIGPSNKCLVFINGKSHPSFMKFSSIRAARIKFMQWAKDRKQS